MGKVSESICRFVREAEVKGRGNLFEYLCEGIGIKDGDTTKAVFIRNKFEEDLGNNPTAEEANVLMLVQAIIGFKQKHPDGSVYANNLQEILEIVQDMEDEEAQIVHRLPENFIELSMHRDAPPVGSMVPAVYYRDGVLLSEQGVPQNEQVWTETGCMNIHCWKVFNDFLQQSMISEQMTNAFSGMSKDNSKYSMDDFKKAIAMIQSKGGTISPGRLLFVRKLVKGAKAAKVSYAGQTKMAKFSSGPITKVKFVEPVSDREIVGIVVNVNDT